jgi:hypothetical protein
LQVLRGWLSALPEKFEDQGYDVEQMIDDLEDELSGLEYEVEEYLAEQETGVEVPAWDLSRRQRARAGSVTNGSEVPDYDPNRSGSVT